MKSLNKFFLLLGVCFLFVYCSDDDNEEINVVGCETFLECQDATVWKQIQIVDNEMFTSYFKLNDNIDNPLEIYSYDDKDGCYYYMDMTQADGLFEIMENSKNKLSVRITGDANDKTEWDMTIESGRLKIDIRNYENNVMYESIQVTLERSSIDTDKLALCDDA